MKILRLRAYFEPELASASQLAKDMDAFYEKSGITVINYTPMPSRGISDKTRKEYKKRKHEILNNGFIEVYRFNMFRERKNAFLRAFRYLCCNVIEYFLGINAKGIDLVHSSSTPPTQGMLSAAVAKKLSKKYGRKVPFVYNLQDIFPDSLVNAGIAKKGGFIWKIGRKIENYTYKNADKIIVISDGFKKNIMAKGVPEGKIEIIPNWGDTTGVYPVERQDNILFDRYNLDRSKFYFSYSGTIGYTQNTDLLLDAAKELKEELKNVRFVLFGEGSEKERIGHRIKTENIDNVILLPFQPSDELAMVFSFADVCFIISKPGVGGSSVPSKTWNIMAAKKPILASFDRESELSHLIEKIGCGCVADAGNRDELKEKIRNLATDTDLKEMGLLGNKYLKSELDKEKCVNKYGQTLISVFENSKQ